MHVWDEIAQIEAVLKEPWLWIIIVSLNVILIGPFIILWFFLRLPPQLRPLAIIAIAISWGIASGFKNWTKKKREEERTRWRT